MVLTDCTSFDWPRGGGVYPFAATRLWKCDIKVNLREIKTMLTKTMQDVVNTHFYRRTGILWHIGEIRVLSTVSAADVWINTFQCYKSPTNMKWKMEPFFFCSTVIMLTWKGNETFSTFSRFSVNTCLAENSHQAIRFHLQVIYQLQRIREHLHHCRKVHQKERKWKNSAKQSLPARLYQTLFPLAWRIFLICPGGFDSGKLSSRISRREQTYLPPLCLSL